MGISHKKKTKIVNESTKEKRKVFKRFPFHLKSRFFFSFPDSAPREILETAPSTPETASRKHIHTTDPEISFRQQRAISFPRQLA
jgi:hypothetical protein